MISDTLLSVSPQQQFNGATIRPIAASEIHGIAFYNNKLYALDNRNGYLLEVDPITHNTKVLNTNHWEDFIGVTGLAIADNKLWFTSRYSVYYCNLDDPDFKCELFIRLADRVNGVAIWESSVYVSSQKAGTISVFDRQNAKEITHLDAPGIGIENITIKGEDLWVSDTLEQSVYCLDRATGKQKFSLLTPFECPTGLTFYHDPETDQDILYVSYINNEPYIRDNPNADPNHELLYRIETFIHPLYFRYYPQDHYALSNGYLVEMTYVEELAPLDPIELKNLEWRMALPAQTHRQKVHKVEPIGLPFTEIIEDGERVAVFKFDTLTEHSRCIFGWKALIEVWGIKYNLTPRDCEKLPEMPPDYGDRYLVDNDNLAMDTDIIKRAAAEAVGRETNLLRKIYNIRNYVYDRLSYGIKPHIDTPDIALRRGVGSCGEYVGVLLALFRLNGIACRTVGRYKCPASALVHNIPLKPDYNHVWLEFYIPGVGWLPMESNPDDIYEGGPYPTRFFMGLAWYHAEMSKGVPFERLMIDGVVLNKQQVSIGNLAINHVQFTILEESSPS